MRKLIFIATLIIFILTFPEIGMPIKPGLDSSYIWALNYSFDKGEVIGRDIIFSYGPLGFLMFPQAIGNNLVIAIVAFIIVKVLFIYLSLKIGFANKNTIVHPIVILFAVFFLSSFVEFKYLFMYILPFSVFMALLCFRETGRLRYLLIGSGMTAFSTLTMMPALVSSVFILISFIFFGIVLRIRKKLKMLELVVICAGFIYFFLIFWLLSNRTFSGIGTYIVSRFEIISGNASAMTISQKENWILNILFIGSVLGVPLLWRNKKVVFSYFLFIPALYTIGKYGYSREDIHHVLYFFDFILIFFIIFFIYIGKNSIRAIGLLFLSLVLLFLNISITFPEFSVEKYGFLDRLIKLDGFSNFYNSVVKYDRRINYLRNISSANLPQSTLSNQILSRIKSEKIDIYPWEFSYIPANNLIWVNRPVFQSYTAYTPWLDKKNEEFIESSNAPPYLLFHNNWETGYKMESIDGRYILNDEPNTIMAIFNNYNIDLIESFVTVLKRDNLLRFKRPAVVGRDEELWNKWINVQNVNKGVLRARVFAKYTILGNIIRSVWKESETYIDYYLENNIVTHRLVVDNMSSGVWVDPYIEYLSEKLEGRKVSAIRFRHTDPQPFEKNIIIEWIFYPFN